MGEIVRRIHILITVKQKVRCVVCGVKRVFNHSFRSLIKQLELVEWLIAARSMTAVIRELKEKRKSAWIKTGKLKWYAQSHKVVYF